VALQVADFGEAQCGQPEYNQTAPNANVILFRDNDWPHENAFSTVAFTEVTFSTETGEIFDADIEINSFASPLTTGDEDVRTDLESILTHEIGHFLGMDHSTQPGATMNPNYSQGDISPRSLSEDEESGICAIYPEGRETSENDCLPRHGFSRVCAANSGGCDVGGRATGATAAAWILLVALGGLRRFRRLRPG
jgi:hypothetical protein